MADPHGERAISQTAVWAFRGRLINEMSHEELFAAMSDLCEYADRLEKLLAELQKVDRPAAFRYHKDVG